MISSIKAAIRAFVAPEHRAFCSRHKWRWIISELNRRGERKNEAGVFLLGVQTRGRLEVTDTVFYDDLDPNAYSTGVCILNGEAFGRLWALCRQRQLTVIADVHTHPGIALQSLSDKTNPMVARSGHIAIIIPSFASKPFRPDELGIYEYRGNHQWIDRTHPKARHFYYTGFWS